MNVLKALDWVQSSNGLILLVGKNKQVTLTDGNTFEITGNGIADAVEKLQSALRAKMEVDSKNTGCLSYEYAQRELMLCQNRK